MEIPEKPKRPVNGLMRYNKEHYHAVKAQNPNAKMTDVTKIMAAKYKALPEKERNKYETKFKEEMEKWRKVNDEWKDKYGQKVKMALKQKEKEVVQVKQQHKSK